MLCFPTKGARFIHRAGTCFYASLPWNVPNPTFMFPLLKCLAQFTASKLYLSVLVVGIFSNFCVPSTWQCWKLQPDGKRIQVLGWQTFGICPIWLYFVTLNHKRSLLRMDLPLGISHPIPYVWFAPIEERGISDYSPTGAISQSALEDTQGF